MLLAIDSGNTNIVFAVFDDRGELLGEWRASSTTNRTADELWVFLTQVMQVAGLACEDIDSAIIASVVPNLMFGLKTLCRKYFKVDPRIVGEDSVRLGIRVLMDAPSEVGADRLVNAISAHEAYPGPAIIIDFGTATTFDLVDGAGDYLGGVIAPGINLSIEALHRAAAKLPPVAVARPRSVIGKATIPAMQSGIYWGYIGLIEGVVARLKAEFAAESGIEADAIDVIATGGLAPLFADATEAIRRADLDLTLRGLYILHRRNLGA